MKRSPGLRSACRLRYFRCSSATPPWPCTMPFGRAGGPRREQHPQRMRERHRGDLQRCVELEDLRPRRDIVTGGCVTQPGHQHGRLQRRQLSANLGEFLAAVNALAAIHRTVAGHQHGRFELPEPRNHAVDGEVRIAHRPRRADAGRAEERGDRLADVRQVPDHPVARLDAEPAQVVRRTPRFPAAGAPTTIPSNRPRRPRRAPGACRSRAGTPRSRSSALHPETTVPLAFPGLRVRSRRVSSRGCRRSATPRPRTTRCRPATSPAAAW